MVRIISVPEASGLLGKEDVVFIDVREEGERLKEHIDPDLWLPLSALAWSESLSTYAVWICYCAAGYRSQKVAEWLEKELLARNLSAAVFSLEDGLWGWKQHRLPLKEA